MSNIKPNLYLLKTTAHVTHTNGVKFRSHEPATAYIRNVPIGELLFLYQIFMFTLLVLMSFAGYLI